jgi:glucose/arabinose dehydrogenase
MSSVAPTCSLSILTADMSGFTRPSFAIVQAWRSARNGRALVRVNERDGLGDDLPADYVTHVAQGAFYGWPWYYLGDHQDPRHKDERTDLANAITTPVVLIQAHSAPLAIAFYAADQFPSDYKGDAFVTLHGSWNRAKRTGYKVVRLLMKDGKPTGEYEDFLVGFVDDDKNVWRRPVGGTVTHDGSLLVSDDGSGSIWQVSY